MRMQPSRGDPGWRPAFLLAHVPIVSAGSGGSSPQSAQGWTWGLLLHASSQLCRPGHSLTPVCSSNPWVTSRGAGEKELGNKSSECTTLEEWVRRSCGKPYSLGIWRRIFLIKKLKDLGRGGERSCSRTTNKTSGTSHVEYFDGLT